MGWADEDGWLTRALAPHISTIIITTIITLTLPILLHLYIYRTRTPASLPTFLLIGPSGSGKTSLITLFEKGRPSTTHTSQTPLSVPVILPDDTQAESLKYRSDYDPSTAAGRRLLIVDTPGHGKLRHFALEQLAKPQNLKGIVYLVDAASLSAEEGLTEAAEYLHQILLTLQKRYTESKTSKGPKAVPVLVAANKLDLFTALPPSLVKSKLEAEITKVRDTKAKGLLSADVDADTGADEETEWLGDGGEGSFEFRQMEHVNVPVEIVGGSVKGDDGPEIAKWWDWIGQQL